MDRYRKIVERARAYAVAAIVICFGGSSSVLADDAFLTALSSMPRFPKMYGCDIEIATELVEREARDSAKSEYSFVSSPRGACSRFGQTRLFLCRSTH
jgi:hypothetical protein